MSEQNKPKGDKRGKIIFLAIAIIAIVWIQIVQWSPSQDLLKDWPEGLEAALDQADREQRRVLVRFISDPPSDATRKLDGPLGRPENIKAIEQGKFIRVHVTLNVNLTSDTAVKYKITSLPTMLILDSKGKEINRRTGYIGEIPFRSEFLSNKVIEKP